MPDNRHIQLIGRILLHFYVETVTGLHIGGSDTGIGIGGVDKTIIRDPLTNRPYIPGSSLKGKMRSLLEKYGGLEQNNEIDRVRIHTCTSVESYRDCSVCQIFGLPGKEGLSLPTRLIVRDIHMKAEEAERLREHGRLDLPYTEVKTETAIDRVTSAALPRQVERVPAGIRFGPAQMVYSIYSGSDCDPAADVERLATLLTGLQLVEDDYLGGLGTRGSGRVRFTGFQVRLRSQANYLGEPESVGQDSYASLADLAGDLATIQRAVRTKLGLAE